MRCLPTVYFVLDTYLHHALAGRVTHDSTRDIYSCCCRMMYVYSSTRKNCMRTLPLNVFASWSSGSSHSLSDLRMPVVQARVRSGYVVACICCM